MNGNVFFTASKLTVRSDNNGVDCGPKKPPSALASFGFTKYSWEFLSVTVLVNAGAS
jgi:hypothetical protein